VDTTAIAAKVAGMTGTLQGTYGVWAEDLPTGATFGQHEHQQFVAASVIKVFILVALYQQAAAGKVSLDEKITTTAADIQNYGTGSIRYDPVGTSYTLAELARRAAKQSDNTAAYLIEKRLGQQFIQDQARAWGCTDTSIADDRTTPADVGTLFAKVASRQLLPPQQALDLLGLLTDTDFEDRLPALLPAYAVVSHKIGTEANGVINDAGVVAMPTRTYVLAIMSTGTDADQVIQAEQRLSLAVFNFEAALP
jgi:beta-lactamase class A